MSKRNLPNWDELKQYGKLQKGNVNGVEQEVVSKVTLVRIFLKVHRVENLEPLPQTWGDFITQRQYEEYFDRYLSTRRSKERGGFPPHMIGFMILEKDELSNYGKTCLFDEKEEEDN